MNKASCIEHRELRSGRKELKPVHLPFSLENIKFVCKPHQLLTEWSESWKLCEANWKQRTLGLKVG